MKILIIKVQNFFPIIKLKPNESEISYNIN